MTRIVPHRGTTPLNPSEQRYLRDTLAEFRRHAARGTPPPAREFYGIDHGAVVGTVAGSLHDDIPFETQVIAERPQIIFGCVAWRVFTGLGVGEPGAWPENVTMCVHGARRHRVLGLGRIRVGVVC